MLVSLDGKVPEDRGVVIPDCLSSGSTHHSLLCSRSYSAHMALYTIKVTLLCLSDGRVNINDRLNNMFLDPEVTSSISGEEHGEA